jgi:hypothetical protein
MSSIIEKIIIYKYIFIFIVSIAIGLLLNNNICLMENENVCGNPTSKKLNNGKTGYSCKNSKKYIPYSLTNQIKYIRILLYSLLIITVCISLFILLVANVHIRNANPLSIILYIGAFIILIIQLLVWTYITVFCSSDNFDCKLNIELSNDGVNDTLLDYKYIKLNCNSNIKPNYLLKKLSNIYTQYYKLLIIVISIILIKLLYSRYF